MNIYDPLGHIAGCALRADHMGECREPRTYANGVCSICGTDASCSSCVADAQWAAAKERRDACLGACGNQHERRVR